MERYHKLMSLFSYLFGFIALIAVLVDDKKDKLYSFYIWQAFLLNVVIAVLSIVYNFYISNKILIIEVSLRTSFFLKSFFIPLSIILSILIVLGILAYKEIKFKIPLIGTLARKITEFEVI